MISLFWNAFKAWNSDKSPRLAAALSFYALFSLPAFLVVQAVLLQSLLTETQFADLKSEFVVAMSERVGDRAALALTDVAQNLQTHPPGLGIIAISLVFLLFMATNLFVELRYALDAIWNDSPNHGAIQNFLRARAASLIAVLGIGVLILAFFLLATSLSPFLLLLENSLYTKFSLFQAVRIIGTVSLITMTFAILYKFIPAVNLRWSDVIIGAAVASLLLAMAERAFMLFLTLSPINSIYGAAGSFVILLVWLFLSIQIFLYGAEITKIYTHRHGSLKKRLVNKVKKIAKSI